MDTDAIMHHGARKLDSVSPRNSSKYRFIVHHQRNAPRCAIMPTQLSIGRRKPCCDGVSAQSGNDDPVHDTDKFSRLLSALDSVHRSITAHLL